VLLVFEAELNIFVQKRITVKTVQDNGLLQPVAQNTSNYIY
jgi:hypothetical protein